jgi:hypothetical protein
LLECARGVVSRDFLWGRSAVRMLFRIRKTYSAETACVHAGPACFTRLADSSHPLDSYPIAHLHGRIVCPCAHLDDLADALVSSYLAGLRGEW